jgi:methylglutaconyl-CoA hydratase
VHEVAADSEAATEGVVEALLAAGPDAVRAAKQLVRERPTGRATAEIAAERRTSAEGQAGLMAFLDNGTPPWRSASSS